MAQQKRKKPKYSPEFMAKAVDIALASILPDKEVARVLGINASTLATWKAKRLKMEGPQPQRPLSLDVEDEQAPLPNQPRTELTHSERMTEQFSQDEPKLAIDAIEGLIPEEAEHLRRENIKLKRENDVLQEAIIILAGSYLRA